MNKPLRISGVSLLLSLLIVLVAGSTFAAQTPQPEVLLDQYIKHIQTTLKQLEAKNEPASERLKIHSDLINGVGFWQAVRGKPSRAMGLVNFFQRRTPSAWNIKPSTSTADSASIEVGFEVQSFPGYPWLTEFGLVKVAEQWQIASFRDLTIRPVVPGADIKTVLERYFRAASDTAESLYSGGLSKEEKQPKTMEFSFGAGYWVGQTRNMEMPAGTLFTFFITRHPKSWRIEPARVAGDYGEADVHFTSKPRHGDERIDTYTIELSRKNEEWFLAGHRSQKDEPEDSPKVVIADAIPIGEDPADITRQQLDILDQADAAMENLFKASEPLWIDVRKARRGLGRLVAMTVGMSGAGEQKPRWEVITTQTEDNHATVTVKAIWPDSAAVKPFNRLSFSLQNTEAGWRLTDAQLLFN